MTKRLPIARNKKSSSQSPAREVFDVLTITYRLLIISSIAALAVIIIAFTASLAFAPTYTISDNSTGNTSKVLGASTNNKGDESFFHKALRVVFSPLGKFNRWVISLADEGTQVANPLTTKEINEIFEYDGEGNVIVKKQLIMLEQPITEKAPGSWDEIKGKPSLLSSINQVEGDTGNIKLAEGNNIQITNNKEEDTITIASTGSVQVTGDSGSGATVNLSAGTGISISGTSPDFTIANASLGSSQNIFKNVAVSGQSAIVSDNNDDTLTFAAGSGVTLTTDAVNDILTIASTGSSVPFSNVQAGTNTNALVIGNGGSLSASGTGTITATNLVATSSVVSDAEVDDTITLTNITQITNRAITDTTGTLTVARGGTGLTTIAAGGILYSSALDTLSRLAPTGAGQVLRSTGANALEIGSLLASDIPSLDASKITTGSLALARGGTGADLSATGGANQFVKQSGAGAAFTVGTIADADVPDTITASNYLPLAGGTMAGNINLNNNLLQNIGAAGTDFSGTGGLTLADALAVSDGGASVTGGLNLNSGGITNAGAIAGASTIGASGAITGGSLTDGTLTISSGALTGGTTATFGTSVTSPSFTGTGAVQLSSGGSAALTLNSDSGTVTIATGDTLGNGTWSINSTGVGTNLSVSDLVAGSSVISDTEVDDNITIGVTGNVDWTALSNYPATCAAGSAVTTLADSPTCVAFARTGGAETITGGWTFNTTATTFSTALNANGGITTTAGNLSLNSTGGQVDLTGNLDVSGRGAFGNSASPISSKTLNVTDLDTGTGTWYGLYSYRTGDNTSIGYGLYGQAQVKGGGGTGGTFYGVYGAAQYGTNNYGVYGIASGGSGGTNYGVYGTASGNSTAWAGYFSGDTKVTGNLDVDSRGAFGSGASIDGARALNLINVDNDDETTYGMYLSNQLTGGLYGTPDQYGLYVENNASGTWIRDQSIVLQAHLTYNDGGVGSSFTGGTDIIRASAGLTTSSGTVGNLKMINITNPTGSANAINDLYGLYMENLSATVVGTKYSIYQTGTSATNVLNANTRIGSASVPTVALDVTGSVQFTGSLTGVLGANTYSFASTNTGGNIFSIGNSGTGLATGGSALFYSGSSLNPSSGVVSNAIIRPYNLNTVAEGGDIVNGLDVQWYQGYIAMDALASTENMARLQLINSTNARTDNAISAGLLIDNADTSAGNQLTITDAIKITASGGSALTNAYTNFINATNFVVTSAGAITAGATTSTHTLTGMLCVKNATACPAQAAGRLYVDTAGTVSDDPGDVFDIAEYFPATESVEPGDLLSSDPNQPKALRRSTGSYDPTLIGIVSTSPAAVIDENFFSVGAGKFDPNHPYLALAGRVLTKVSTENGSIAPGDPLTSSSTSGVAMKATISGPIVGKALEAYGGSGVGKIMVFVTTSWYVAELDAGSGISDLSNLTSLSVENLTANIVTTQILFVGNTKLSMAKNGGLKIEGDVEITGEVSAKKLNVSEESAGSATLEAGKTKVEIETNVITDKSQVMITLTTLTEKSVAVTKKEVGKGFTVEIASPETKDIHFDWFIVN